MGNSTKKRSEQGHTPFRRLTVSANHGSAGKSSCAVGILRAFRRRGLSVQPFKKGPDFIDPMWHTLAAGRVSRNLDYYMAGDTIAPRYCAAAEGADLALIEGNQGLFDSVEADGGASTAALARQLRSPVVLVIDCRKMTRGIAPLLLGYRHFEPETPFAGVILNFVGTGRHEERLRAAVARYTDFVVLGAIPRAAAASIEERHLGLTTSGESAAAEAICEEWADLIERSVDLEQLLQLADASPLDPPSDYLPQQPVVLRDRRLRLAQARDAAFSFYYPENCEALEAQGIELVSFSPLHDRSLPEGVSGVWIGGGFPELFAADLAANHQLRSEIARRVEAGMPCYAECGGLLYLSHSLTIDGRVHPMADVLPLAAEMTSRPQGRGYMLLSVDCDVESRWVVAGELIRCHEFHYTRAELIADHRLADSVRFQYNVKRGSGIVAGKDGIEVGAAFASYAHLFSPAAPWWAERFVQQLRSSADSDRLTVSASHDATIGQRKLA